MGKPVLREVPGTDGWLDEECVRGRAGHESEFEPVQSLEQATAPGRDGTAILAWDCVREMNEERLTLLLVPKNPLATREEELRPLADELTGDGVSVRYTAYEQRGYGVTLWEVLGIYFVMKAADAVTGRAFDVLVDRVKEKAFTWYRRRRQEKGSSRPFALEIRDGDGNLIKAFHLKRDGDVEEAGGAPKLPPPPVSDNQEE